MDIQTTFDALTDLVAEVISASFMSTIAEHDATRKTAQNLRDGALVQALLGAQLAKLVSFVTVDAERKTAIRYSAYLKHPRLGRGPLIDEAEDADVSFNVAAIAAQRSPGATQKIDYALAALRVRAVTQAIGPACIYPPHDAAMPGRTGSRQRRREITAADVPDEVAAILLRPISSEEDQAALVRSLRELEPGEHNRGALVTKIIALADQPEGHVVLNTIAGHIRRARFERGTGTDPEGRLEPASLPVRTTTKAPPVSASEKPVVPSQITSRVETASSSQSQTSTRRSPPASTEVSHANAPPLAAPLRAGLEHRGTKVPSARDRLAQAHAQRRARPQ
jgi:hypothetical protein